MKENPLFKQIIRWLVIVGMPFFLGFGMITAVVAWDYPSFEYQRIPPDRYGFTLEQRLEYAHITLDYLQRWQSAEEVIYLLEDAILPDGETPLYNEREIGHMLDVKHLTDAIRWIWFGVTVIVLAGLAFLWWAERSLAIRILFHAGLGTVGILTALALFIALGWSIFFVQFHELLFPPGTWTFSYSDSLIRLFPEQFWFDVGIILSVGTLLLGAVVAGIGFVLQRKLGGATPTNRRSKRVVKPKPRRN